MLAYRPPSVSALACRRKFYSSYKLADETISDWFERIADSVPGCEFDNLADIMLIDKFLSGLDETVCHQILEECNLDSTRQLLSILESESLQENCTEGVGDNGALIEAEIEQVKNCWKLNYVIKIVEDN